MVQNRARIIQPMIKVYYLEKDNHVNQLDISDYEDISISFSFLGHVPKYV